MLQTPQSHAPQSPCALLEVLLLDSAKSRGLIALLGFDFRGAAGTAGSLAGSWSFSFLEMVGRESFVIGHASGSGALRLRGHRGLRLEMLQGLGEEGAVLSPTVSASPLFVP